MSRPLSRFDHHWSACLCVRWLRRLVLNWLGIAPPYIECIRRKPASQDLCHGEYLLSLLFTADYLLVYVYSSYAALGEMLCDLSWSWMENENCCGIDLKNGGNVFSTIISLSPLHADEDAVLRTWIRYNLLFLRTSTIEAHLQFSTAVEAYRMSTTLLYSQCKVPWRALKCHGCCWCGNL